MKKTVLLAFISVLPFSVIIQMVGPVTTENFMPTPVPNPFPPHYTRTRSTRNMRFFIRSNTTFENCGTDTWNLTAEDRAISLLMNNTWQTVFVINHSHPFEKITEDEDGNSIAVLDVQRYLQPGESVSYSVSYNVFSKLRTIPDLNENESGKLEDIPENLREEFCVSQPPWLVEDEEIREVASDIAEDETRVLTIIKKFAKCICENIQFPSQRHEHPYYPNETLKEREGDCDDQAILFVTFCRAYGIPSFIQVGCVYLPDFYANITTWEDHISYEFRRIGWHGWTIAYIPPWGWLPIDLTYVMGSLAEPLNAIYHGAVTLQETIQESNISRVDYVASSRTYRDLLLQNDFYLHSMDEMTMTLLGDLNCDFIVNTPDISIIAKSFGSELGDEDWNELAEINGDRIVDIYDVATVATDFGKTA